MWPPLWSKPRDPGLNVPVHLQKQWPYTYYTLSKVLTSSSMHLVRCDMNRQGFFSRWGLSRFLAWCVCGSCLILQGHVTCNVRISSNSNGRTLTKAMAIHLYNGSLWLYTFFWCRLTSQIGITSIVLPRMQSGRHRQTNTTSAHRRYTVNQINIFTHNSKGLKNK